MEAKDKNIKKIEMINFFELIYKRPFLFNKIIILQFMKALFSYFFVFLQYFVFHKIFVFLPIAMRRVISAHRNPVFLIQSMIKQHIYGL